MLFCLPETETSAAVTLIDRRDPGDDDPEDTANLGELAQEAIIRRA